MLVACTTSTDQDFATTGDVMMILFQATTTSFVATTGAINHLGRLVTRASQWAETYLGYPLGLAIWSESLAAYGGRRLVTARTPIRGVLRMFDSTATCEATAICSSDFVVENAEAGLIARDKGWDWTAVQRVGEGTFSMGLTPAIFPGTEERPWLVEYSAGFIGIDGLSTSSDNYTTQATTSTGTTLPGDIRHAVALKAAAWYANALGVTSRHVGDLSVNYRSEDQDPAEAILRPYRRVF